MKHLQVCDKNQPIISKFQPAKTNNFVFAGCGVCR